MGQEVLSRLFSSYTELLSKKTSLGDKEEIKKYFPEIYYSQTYDCVYDLIKQIQSTEEKGQADDGNVVDPSQTGDISDIDITWDGAKKTN